MIEKFLIYSKKNLLVINSAEKECYPEIKKIENYEEIPKLGSGSAVINIDNQITISG